MEPLTETELAIVRIFGNAVLFREFINQEDTDNIVEWKPLEDHERAWSTCTSPFIAMCCGRSVHKTTSMIEMLYWWAVNRMFIPGEPGLFVLVPNKAQKDLSFFRIRSACLSHWLIKQYVNPNEINQTEGKINFLNGFQLLMRLSGDSGKESNIIGVHTYRIWVDEAQGIPWQAWLSLQNCLKKEISGYQMIVSGVPTGARQDNVLYECDQNDEDYVSFNIAQTMMSWWNPDIEYEARKRYHAQAEDSEDYKHYVLGQHGTPSFSVFDRARFLIEPYEIQKIPITQHMVESCRRMDLDGKERYHFEEIVICPPVPTELGRRPIIGVGWDVGFSPDPSVFFIIMQTPQGTWQNLVRFVLQRVEYPIQKQIFAWIDSVYNFNFLGIDMGGPGKVVYQELTNDLSEFKPYHYHERLYPVEFGSYVTVAIDENGKERKDQTKRVAMDMLSRWVHEHKLSFAKGDEDLMAELERTKFMRTITGEPVYRTDNDHQMAALMCALLANENKYGSPVIIPKNPIIPKLLSAYWIDPMEYAREG